MRLSLEILNSDATLNNFENIDVAEMVRGSDVTLVMRIIQPDRENIRYIPDGAATFSITLQNSDGSTLSKTPSQPFAEDGSILSFDLTASETQNLVSQDLNLEVTEGSKLKIALARSALRILSKNEEC